MAEAGEGDVYLLSLFFGKENYEELVAEFMSRLRESRPPSLRVVQTLGYPGSPILSRLTLDLESALAGHPTLEIDPALAPVDVKLAVRRAHKGDAIRLWLAGKLAEAGPGGVLAYVDGEGIHPRHVWDAV